MLLEALKRLKVFHLDQFPVHEKRRVTVITRPAGHLGVVSLAPADHVSKELNG